jgi:acyl-CoA thioester hydrolase
MKWLETETTVRFNEIDQWGIAWYGHYMAWFEVGRMALLREVDLLPEHMVQMGYIAPIINVRCDYKHPARCDDRIIIRTTVVEPKVAALTFKFEILRKKDRVLLARGETTQVLLTTDQKMIYRVTGELEERIIDLVEYCR